MLAYQEPTKLDCVLTAKEVLFEEPIVAESFPIGTLLISDNKANILCKFPDQDWAELAQESSNARLTHAYFPAEAEKLPELKESDVRSAHIIDLINWLELTNQLNAESLEFVLPNPVIEQKINGKELEAGFLDIPVIAKGISLYPGNEKAQSVIWEILQDIGLVN